MGPRLPVAGCSLAVAGALGEAAWTAAAAQEEEEEEEEEGGVRRPAARALAVAARGRG